MEVSYLNLFFIFILGTLVGSFVNVLALRFNSGLSYINSRSKCFSCDANLKWYELIPVLSFVLQRGRCRTCNSKISSQYPLIEFLMGLIFVGIFIRQTSLWPIYSEIENGIWYLLGLSVYYYFVFSLLVATTIYDYRHKIIPNAFVYLFIFLGLAKLILFIYIKYPLLGREDIFDLLSPFILFSSFALLWVVSRGRWIGFGDAKLVLGIGALLGFVYGIGAVILGFWIGAIWSILLLINYKILNKGSISMNSEVPFAPFLIAGTILVFLFRFDVLSLSAFFGN